MTRVKRGTIAHKRRKKVLKQAKGFHWGRKSKYRLAKDALFHAWTHAYYDRKRKKSNFRRLWQIRIGNALKSLGLSYNRFVHSLRLKKVGLDRKVLAQLAKDHPQVFEKLVREVQREKP